MCPDYEYTAAVLGIQQLQQQYANTFGRHDAMQCCRRRLNRPVRLCKAVVPGVLLTNALVVLWLLGLYVVPPPPPQNHPPTLTLIHFILWMPQSSTQQRTFTTNKATTMNDISSGQKGLNTNTTAVQVIVIPPCFMWLFLAIVACLLRRTAASSQQQQDLVDHTAAVHISDCCCYSVMIDSGQSTAASHIRWGWGWEESCKIFQFCFWHSSSVQLLHGVRSAAARDAMIS